MTAAMVVMSLVFLYVGWTGRDPSRPAPRGIVPAVAASGPPGLLIVAETVSTVALTALSTVQINLVNPVYVNPGEFVAVVKKQVGTAPSAGVVAHTITYDYSWE